MKDLILAFTFCLRWPLFCGFMLAALTFPIWRRLGGKAIQGIKIYLTRRGWSGRHLVALLAIIIVGCSTLRQEKAEYLLQVAVDKQQTGDFSAALVAYTDLVINHSDSELVKSARNGAEALFEQVELAALASQETCDRIDTLLGNDLIPQRDTNLPLLYLACGHVYRQEGGNYEAAIKAYNILINNFPDTEAAVAASQTLGETYEEWGQYLQARQEYLEAMDKFIRVPEFTDDPEILAAARQGYNDAVWALSQDTGPLGREIIQETWTEVCQGRPATSLAVGLVEDEPRKAWFGGSEFRLPDELQAASPGHFHHAVCLAKEVDKIQECEYTFLGVIMPGQQPSGTIIRQQRVWRVTVRDTRTADIMHRETFRGSLPSACPSSITGRGHVIYTGDDPSASEIIDRLKSVFTAAPQATIVAHSSWPLFLSDAFNSNENHWSTGDFSDESATGSQLITNGVYRWDMKAHQNVGWWAFPDVAPVSDFYLTVETKRVSGPESSSYGIVFRMVDDANYYVFAISDYGQFGLHLLHDNQSKTLVDWTRTSAIQPGKVNRLAVSAEGSYFVFSINDQIVSEVSDSQLSSGIAGVVMELYNANDTAVFEFDNFELRTPQAPSLTLLSKGERLAREGKIEEAIAAYAEAQKLDPTLEIFSYSWNTLCWFGSLWGYAADVIDACEQAVELAPDDGGIRDSRGLARALTGDYPGAIEDFKFTVEWLRKNELYEQFDGAKREAWIAELEAGRNPFDEITLSELREE